MSAIDIQFSVGSREASTETLSSSQTAARAAISDTTPFAVALIPFGLAVGGASATAGLAYWEAMFGGVVLLAGAAQLAAIDVIGSGGSILLTAMVVGLINLRFVFYGAGVANWFADAPLRRRLLLAFPVVDQTFMLCQERFATESDPAWRQRYYLTVTAVLAGTFLTSQAIAFQLGATLPAGLGLHLAAPLAFAGMLAKATKGRQEIIAAAAAGLTILVGTNVVGAFALPMAVVVGVSAAAVSRQGS